MILIMFDCNLCHIKHREISLKNPCHTELFEKKRSIQKKPCYTEGVARSIQKSLQKSGYFCKVLWILRLFTKPQYDKKNRLR